MKTLTNPADEQSILQRLRSVTPDSQRRWGTMTPNQLFCHLADSYGGVIGERPMEMRDSLVARTLMKWFALYAPLPWPKGIKTGRYADQKRSGTPPAEFERDRATLEAIQRRFIDRVKGGAAGTAHPLFGRLSTAEWGRWGYLHMDHHLRQFGV